MTDAVPAETGPFYHGTRVDLPIGGILSAGWDSNFGSGKAGSWIYFAGTLEAAIWGAELAVGGARQRIYVVEPTGPWFDDPNLTDQKFPGNPTRSYRSQMPLRIVDEVREWTPHPPEQLQAMKDFVARMKAEGVEAID